MSKKGRKFVVIVQLAFDAPTSPVVDIQRRVSDEVTTACHYVTGHLGKTLGLGTIDVEINVGSMEPVVSNYGTKH